MSDKGDKINKLVVPRLQSTKSSIFMVDYTGCDVSELAERYGEGSWPIPRIRERALASILETTGLTKGRCAIHYGKFIPVDKTVVVGEDISVVKLYTDEETTFVGRGCVGTIEDCGIVIKFFYSFD